MPQANFGMVKLEVRPNLIFGISFMKIIDKIKKRQTRVCLFWFFMLVGCRALKRH